MELYPVAVILTALAAAGLGLVVYLRAPDRPANRLHALNTTLLVVWAVTTLGVEAVKDAATLDLLLRLIHLVGVFVLVTFVDFVWVFPERLRVRPPRARQALYLSGVIAGSFVWIPALITKIEVTPRTPHVEFGWPLILLGLYFLPVMVHVNVVLWHKMRTLHGVARLQTLYVFAGTLVTVAIMFPVLLALPMITGHAGHSRWGVVGYLVLVVGMAIAIAKHRLWDLSYLERRVAAGALAVGALAPVAALLVAVIARMGEGVENDAVVMLTAATVTGAVLGLCLPPVYAAFQGLLSRSLQDEARRIGQFLSALSTAVVHAPSGEGTLTPLLTESRRFFQAAFMDAYVLGPGDAYVSAGSVDADDEDPLPRMRDRVLPPHVARGLGLGGLDAPLDAGHLARFGTVEQTAHELAAMQSLGAEVVVPLRWQQATIGVLVAGPKLSRDAYHGSDLDLLNNVAAHAAIATRNAELRQEILAEKERTEKVLTQMESGVVAVDSVGNIRLLNPAVCRLLHCEDGTLQDRPLTALPRELARLVEQALYRSATVSGARVWLEGAHRVRVAASTFVLLGTGGRCEGAGVVFRDLRTEDALAQSEREAEQLRFIRAVSAGMAHEIRNPLVAIRTFTELLPTHMDDPEFRESFLQVAQAEVTRLEELVSQFMTLSKPTRDLRSPVDVRGLLESAVTTVSARAHGKGIYVSVEVLDGLPHPRGDQDRLHQALINLLLNALDATPEGGRIILRASAESTDPAGTGDIAITVWNSGSYIPPEEQDRVFEPFFTSKADGTGLGLAICRTIADEHGGTTRVVSSAETGTAFTITVPIIPAQDALAEAMP